MTLCRKVSVALVLIGILMAVLTLSGVLKITGIVLAVNTAVLVASIPTYLIGGK